MRLAYLGDLPPQIIRREVRSPYSSVAEQYCRENRRELLALFGSQSMLAQFDVIDPHKIKQIIASSTDLQYHCRWFVRAASVEIWLRSLAGIALPPTPETEEGQYSSPGISYTKMGMPASGTSSLAQVRDGVLVYQIHETTVFIDSETNQVSRLDQLGTIICALLLSCSSWETALTQLHDMLEPTRTMEQIQAMLFSFAHQLVQEGWIALQQPLPEDVHVLSTNL
jgi:hypothetical protein